jgi:hypothetical protein
MIRKKVAVLITHSIVKAEKLNGKYLEKAKG